MPKPTHYTRCIITLWLILFWTSHLFAQRRVVEPFDVLDYSFEISVSDTDMSVSVLATHTIRLPKDTLLNLLRFDFSNQMIVNSIAINELPTQFIHKNDLLDIMIDPHNMIDTVRVSIQYHGVPLGGLYISRNEFGAKTFFTDHWPDRAHHWLPVVDHLTEKATVQFKVYAPKAYHVISNGILQSREEKGDYAWTHWKTEKPIPTKVIALGVADFNIMEMDDFSSVWVYAQTSEKRASDFDDVSEILDFLETLLGDLPFDKLDHVESNTRFGGMENASCIFYNDMIINGNHDINALIAHEVAHQWFGNSVTEKKWEDIWLSEGFATFYQEEYLESEYGADSLRIYLDLQEQIIEHYEMDNPESTIVQRKDNLSTMLNPLTYQKAAWFLRMLKYKLGDEIFLEVIKAYLSSYQYGNASTNDFLKIAESVSGLILDNFFRQWLYQQGGVDMKYHWSQKKGRVKLKVLQMNNTMYQIDFDVLIGFEDETVSVKRISMDKKKETFVFNVPKKIKSVDADPLNVVYGRFSESIDPRL